MAIPELRLPVTFDNVPSEIKRLGDHARALQLELDVCRTLIDAVRASCPHPKDKLTHYTDRSGTCCSACSHCGREW